MKLCTFTHGGTTRLGVLEGEEIVDLARALPTLPRDMLALLALGDAALAAVRSARNARAPRILRRDAHLRPPVLRPPKFLGIGLNYRDHAAEGGREVPTFPVFFNKQSTCVTGPFDDIHVPRASSAVDYEGELAFVVGKRCRHVPASRAREVIAGYMVANDVSVRDFQSRAPTMTLGKSFDTHGPLGPALVTPDEVEDPHALGLRTFVNGEERQSSNTRQLVFDCWAQVEWLSKVFTLEPGDVVSTGTPGGVGVWRKPPLFLRAGDVVRIEVDRVGVIENRVVDEPSDAPRIESGSFEGEGFEEAPDTERTD